MSFISQRVAFALSNSTSIDLGSFIADTMKLLEDLTTSEQCTKDGQWEQRLRVLMKLCFETVYPQALNSSVISETLLVPLLRLFVQFTDIPQTNLRSSQ